MLGSAFSFAVLLLVVFGFTGMIQRNDASTTLFQKAVFKFTVGDSTYFWPGDKRYSNEIGSGIEANRMDSIQILYVVYAAGGNGDRIMIAFLANGQTILRHSSKHKKSKISIRVDAHFLNRDWNNDHENDSTVQFSFTSFHDSMADGTFSGLVSSGNKKLIITRGEFHNVKESYRSP